MRPEPRLTHHPDGIGRVEAVRRLLALADQTPRRIYSLRFWARRLAALWRVWRTRWEA